MSRTSNQLPTVSASDAVEAAFLAVSAIQTMPAGKQVAGVFLLARVIAQQLGLDVSDLFNQSDRRLKEANTFYKREAQALSDYVNGELQ
jgi:triphosphoribosyl-dephospho-CoA synthetase